MDHLSSRLFFLALGFTWAVSLKPVFAEDDTAFGQSNRTGAALIGALYDLKQTPDRKPTGIDPGDGYSHVIDEFISKNWDEVVLNKFFQVSKPLYTTQIFIPNMDAGNAPKAFGAEKAVKPSEWLIHYKGQVSPPSAGTYRFWGAGDDILAVAVNGKTVLVANRSDTHLTLSKWKSSIPDGAQAADDPLRAGDWITLKTDEIIDLDVIIGERPGGLFNAFLLIEKQGEIYGKDSAGNPILPIFQVARYNTPVIEDLGMEPKFAKDFPVWKCYQ